jgi:O-antigen biosynthesis protein WbqP
MFSKRLFDIALALVLSALLAVPMLLIGAAIRLTSRGPAVYSSNRVGRDNVIFRMPKFRSMYVGAPAVATHLLANPDEHITPIGRALRRTSLDELPQLWSVLKGDMSFVGPRPALFNQDDLVALRTAQGVHRLRPGITGWAQINGRDELSIEEKVRFDRAYLERQSLAFDLRILALTALQVIRRHGISH